MTELIVCCDGTWNTPDQREGGLPAPTNVVKFGNALAPSNAAGEQRKYYHPGVGTDGGQLMRLAGGGLGKGLDDNIKSAYGWLAREYRPGDRIWLIGFSRGAYTVRCLGGMVTRSGLVDLSDETLPAAAAWKQVDEAFENYRRRGSLTATAEVRYFNTPTGGATAKTTPVHFIGVWDTVGALGIPNDLALLDLFDLDDHSFHDTELSDNVKNARHAVAMDERRDTFSPTLWTKVEDRPDVQQIWFPGVHGDVGGGYSSAGLSNGALLWMIEACEALGLRFRDSVKQRIEASAHGVLHESLTGFFRSLTTRPRQVPRIGEGAPGFHGSAIARHLDPALEQTAYWESSVIAAGGKASCDVYARDPWNATGFFLEGGVAYDFAATGEWLDATIACGPGGADDARFDAAKAAQIAASVLDRAEDLFKKLTRNKDADFWYSRREGEYPWFALVGVIANGAIEDAGGLPRHETVLIGTGTTFTPMRGGYLYCFANDAWLTYGNNRGSVRLTVGRAA